MNNSFFITFILTTIFISIIAIFIPSGKFNKQINICISCILIIIILSPILSFFKNKEYLLNDFNSIEYETYLSNLKNNAYKIDIISMLKINNIEVTGVDFDYIDENNTIENLKINFSNSSINEDTEHIDVSVKIKNILETNLKLNVLNVEIVYE